MHNGVYLGFDFGFSRIGVAVGQTLTASATPLVTLSAKQGQPNWQQVEKLIRQWHPLACIVGIPTDMDGKKLYTTRPAEQFSKQIETRFSLPVYLVDERLTTKEAKAQLFESGGYKKLQSSGIDSVAASLILEQWLRSETR